jgi:hypothetical protein
MSEAQDPPPPPPVAVPALTSMPWHRKSFLRIALEVVLIAVACSSDWPASSGARTD